MWNAIRISIEATRKFGNAPRMTIRFSTFELLACEGAAYYLIPVPRQFPQRSFCLMLPAFFWAASTRADAVSGPAHSVAPTFVGSRPRSGRRIGWGPLKRFLSGVDAVNTARNKD